MIRFPHYSAKVDATFLVFDNKFYAKHNVMKVTSTEKYVGFLTAHTLFFVLRGKKYFYFDNRKIEVNADKPLLLKRGIYSMSEQITGRSNFEALMIFIPDKFFHELSTEHKLSTKETSFVDYASLIQTPLLETFRDNYLSYFSSTEIYLQHILDLKLRELFFILLSSRSKKLVERFILSISSKGSYDFDYLIKENVLKTIGISDLAKLSGRSLSSFKRDFHRRYNTSPRNWINNKRLEHAHRYLTTTDKRVSEVAFSCGFESVSHFIKLFKKHFGFTPSQLRAK